MKKISVLGCGWLGFPLAQKLLSTGHVVKGSTTSFDKMELMRSSGIDPYMLILNPDLRTKNIETFLESEFLIINIPPGRVEEKVLYHTYQIKVLVTPIKNSSIEKIIYISSTSVYGDDCRRVSENDFVNPVTEGGKAVKAAEELLKTEFSSNLTIIRFGGLIGENRTPARILTRKNIFEDGNVPINLIHLNDCIGIISEVIIQDKFGEIFNGVCSKHLTKEEFYTKAAINSKIKIPIFKNSAKQNFKIVDNTKVKTELNYKFIFDDPLKMLEGN